MKKFLFILAGTIPWMMTSNAQNRLVLYEEFSGENCPPCAQANPGLMSLIERNDSNIILIKYQSPIPSAGPIYNQYKPDVDNRRIYYQINFAPSGRMDGIILGVGQQSAGHVGYLGQSSIDSRAAVPSPFDITATHRYSDNGDSVYVTVEVTCVAAYSGSLRLRTALVENLHYTQPPGTNGEREFHNVVRHMYPDANGTTITNSWTPGTTETYTISGPVPSYVIKGMDTRAVVWIQNDADKDVAQAAASTPVFPASVAAATATVGEVQVAPNPARNMATVSFTLQTAANVQVQVLDAAGRLVSNTGSRQYAAGAHKVDINTQSLPAGLYHLRIFTGANSVTERLSILK